MYAALRCSTISTHPYFISCVWYKVNERYCIRDSISTNLYTVVTIFNRLSASGSGFISSVASSCTETVNEIKYKLALEDRNAPLFINKNETVTRGLIFINVLAFQGNQ